MSDAPSSARLRGLPASLAKSLGSVDFTRHSTLRSGGRAPLLRLSSAEEAALFFEWHARDGVPFYLLGRASNLIARDGEIDILMVAAKSEGGPTAEDDLVTCGADLLLPSLMTWAADEGRGGLEWGAGIPGSVGGCVRMNAGTSAGEMKDDLVEALVASPRGCAWMKREDLGLSYRHSGLADDELVLAARLRLPRIEPAEAALRKERIREYLRKRNASQPLAEPSFGSTFANPPGGAAARLVEECGLKGRRRGDMAVSTKHANFVVNLGGGLSADARALVGEVRAEVHRRTGVLLRPEVRTVGLPPWEDA